MMTDPTNTDCRATMAVTRPPGAAASHRLAWTLTTTTRLYLVIAVSCFARPCGAFLFPSPAGSTKLQLTHDTASGHSRCRRPCSATREGATAAESQGRSNVGEETELRLMTWVEVEARVKRDTAETGKAAVIVPVGATEQHGPNGLIGTDHMTAEAVARGVCEVTGAILAPTINYGMSHHHESFPGTVTLRPATFVAVVRDVAASLSGAGFTHVLFVNGHGGNVGPAFKAFADFAAEQQQAREMEEEEAESSGGGGGGGGDGDSTARVKLISWYAGRESSTLAKELYGGEIGQHATPDEVAVTQHLFPEAVKYGVELDPAAIQVAKDLGGMTKRIKDAETGLSVMDVQDFRRRFPDGRMFSNPALATPEHGRRLLEAAVRDVTDALGKFLSGQDVVEEAEAKAKRAAAMAAAAAAAEAAAATEGKKKAGKTSFTPRARWGDDDDTSNGSGGGGRSGRGRGRRRGGEGSSSGGGGGGGGGVQQAAARRAGGETTGAAAGVVTGPAVR